MSIVYPERNGMAIQNELPEGYLGKLCQMLSFLLYIVYNENIAATASESRLENGMLLPYYGKGWMLPLFKKSGAKTSIDIIKVL